IIRSVLEVILILFDLCFVNVALFYRNTCSRLPSSVLCCNEIFMETRALEKKVKELEAANDILKKALAFFAGSQKK
ncbi:MAG: hypothetical protein WA131_11430, partial [Desulfitobacteriaceae bacterium]